MMKKGKVFGRGQAILVIMVLALGAAVWINMRYSSEKYLGEAKYVNTESKTDAIETSAKIEKEDIFKSAVKNREEALKNAQEIITETLKSDKLSEEDKVNALKKAEDLADRIEKESNIETLLKSKGFEKVIAVIGDKNINIIVSSDGLTTAQTLQIQDIVTSETDVELGNIKIVASK